ncbi:hypothetical protein QFZ60_001563 [Arthrobacter sp. B2I5]|uniref:hypothetical protein n=1 Tax=Arthrobacter sp. B2I5 TaxID=3042266 RepID=UPI00277EDA3D|nr:hypothetical protein [Arthrobacter sp. B2I5]MDQ0825390.1 hypothetical protein [Arthrobacter sp. B2I5]
MTQAEYKLFALNTAAESIYGLEDAADLFYKVFTREYLVLLWENFCVYTDERMTTASYDDEVYDALARHGYWGEAV